MEEKFQANIRLTIVILQNEATDTLTMSDSMTIIES